LKKTIRFQGIETNAAGDGSTFFFWDEISKKTGSFFFPIFYSQDEKFKLLGARKPCPHDTHEKQAGTTSESDTTVLTFVAVSRAVAFLFGAALMRSGSNSHPAFILYDRVIGLATNVLYCAPWQACRGHHRARAPPSHMVLAEEPVAVPSERLDLPHPSMGGANG
jgi:hypothetical protein